MKVNALKDKKGLLEPYYGKIGPTLKGGLELKNTIILLVRRPNGHLK